MTIRLRKARPADRDRVIEVEAASTPGLRYVARVWDRFLGDAAGDWSVAEAGGVIVGCGKYTLLPDGSVWLETLRVVPEWQRQGVGKRFYKHWLTLAGRRGASTLRMYTGLSNRASKGLAERFGFQLAGVFKEARRSCGPGAPAPAAFRPVTDPDKAAARILPLQGTWNLLVMNRTFYAFTPELCRYLAAEGMVHADAAGNVVVLGARFLPEDALHVGAMAGNYRAALDFALARARATGAGRVNVQFPPEASDIAAALAAHGFAIQPADFIVMELRLGGGAAPRKRKEPSEFHLEENDE